MSNYIVNYLIIDILYFGINVLNNNGMNSVGSSVV